MFPPITVAKRRPPLRSASSRAHRGARRSAASCRHRAVHLTHPLAINLRRNLRWFNLAATAPEDIRVAHRNSAGGEMFVDRTFVLEKQFFVGAVRDRHDINVAKLWPGFAPITVRQNVMTPD